MEQSDLKWLDDDFSNYGVVQLDNSEPSETQPIHSVPAVKPSAPISIKPTLKDTFQVDTSLVIMRLKKAMWPLKSENFFEDSSADLYTPFWLVTTLILIVSAAGTMTSQSISVLVSSATLYYGLALIVPACLYCLLSHNGSSLDYYTLVSFYGYSFVHFTFAGVVGAIGHWVARCIVWAAASLLSLWFLKKNLWEEVCRVMPTQRLPVACIIVSGHALLVFATNFYFLAASSQVVTKA